MRRRRRGYLRLIIILAAVIVALLTTGLLFNWPLPVRDWIGGEPSPGPSPSATAPVLPTDSPFPPVSPTPVPTLTPSPAPVLTSTPVPALTPSPAPAPMPTDASAPTVSPSPVPYTPDPTLMFEQVDFINAPRYSDRESLIEALIEARASMIPQLAIRLDKDITLDEFRAALAIFDGTIEYAYGTMSGTDDLCALVSFGYTPGARIARAYKTGTADFLTRAEQQVLETARTWLLSANAFGANPLLTERAIHDYICEQARYFDDQTDEPGAILRDYQTAVGLFADGKGNCMAYADAFLMLARMAGFECDTIIGEAANERGEWIGHAWNVIRINGEWLMCDVTYDDLDSPPFTMGYAYFNVDRTAMSANHRWAEGALYRPVAPTLDDMYGFGNSLFPELRRAISADEFKAGLEDALTSAEPDETWFMLDGFSVDNELIQRWMSGWKLTGGWLMIHQELGDSQYWIFKNI